MRDRRSISAACLGLVVLALALLGPVGRFVDTSSAWLTYPYARPGSEGLILYETILLKQGRDIYAPITPTSFISGPYPPVYYWLAAMVLPDHLPDFTASNHTTSLLQPGRVISLASALLAAALLALLVVIEGGYFAHDTWTIGLTASAGIVGGALFLTLPQTLVWATRFRGDMLMIALTAAGLVCIAAGASIGRNAGQSRWWSTLTLALGAVAFALALFTKQTALAGPVASALYLLLRDWRTGLKWSAFMLLAIALPFVLLDITTGHWFYLKMVVYHSLPFSRSTFVRLLHFALWDEEWPLLVLAIGFSLYALWRLRKGSRAYLIPLFVIASLVTLPTGAVVGADHNHLLMIGLAISAGVGALLAWIVSQREAWPLLKFTLIYSPPVLLLVVYALYASTPSAVAYGPDLTLPSPQEQEQLRKITLYVRNTPGDIFYADDQGVLALAGKNTLYDDPFTMTALATTERWDETALRDMLRQGKFARLMLSCDVGATLAQTGAKTKGTGRLCRADVFTSGVLEAIDARYQVLFRDVLFTYVPR